MFSRSTSTAIVATILSVSLLGGCSAAAPGGSANNGGGNGSGNPGSSATPSAAAKITAPLTGISYGADNKFLAGPVVMGKIDNSPEARPQLGLNSTDIVIDEMVEGGLTRFLAIWHSKQPTEFGPLRSVRPMDPDLATAFGGIIAYSGGQRPFVAAMKATGLYNADETSEHGKGTMERVANRVAPHNLFVKAQALQAAHLNLAAPKPAFSFVSDESDANPVSAFALGKAVNEVKVQFPAATATWDWKNGRWLRTQDGKALTDAADGKQITAANVIVLRVAVDRSYRDPKYGYVPKTLLEGTGKGTVFGSGKALDVVWTKTSQSNYVQLTDGKGQTVQLVPGNTWFELVPSDVGKVTVTPAVAPAQSGTPKPKS